MAELESTRLAVRREILSAPSRRLDNLLTETEEAARRVWLCGSVCNAMRRSQTRQFWGRLGVLAAAAVLAPASTVGVFLLLHDLAPAALLGSVSAVGVGLLWKQSNDSATAAEKKALSSMDLVLRDLYPGKSLTEEVRQRWLSVKPVIEERAREDGVANLPAFGTRELRHVQDIFESELPELRKQVDALKRSSDGDAPPR
jgi:hypothetical protein